MVILAVFRNFFGYYQNAEKMPFLQNFFVQYFVAYTERKYISIDNNRGVDIRIDNTLTW